MLNTEQLAAAALALWNADETKQVISPLTEAYPEIDVVDAYGIQLLNINKRLEAGALVRGHKVGLSAKAMQQMLGVHEPDYGHLLDDMFVDEGASIPIGRFCQPRAEIEVAFVLGRRLEGPGVTIADVMRATDYVLPSIEIVDSRVADWKIKIQDTIADNASSAALVLGGRPTRLHDIDPALIGATLRKNGEIVETGCSGAVLGNPAIAVAWLANKVAQFGVALEPGHVIMPGSCTRMIPVVAGDHVRADFDGLGHVAVRFV
ncbi:MAG: 2-keto-4-pentenoate hydratase [Ilumatobacteraceae bacterium]|jgi:2-keto-4-pentenoate hydratase|nr:2-keto-4-pentenoate hydratase [Acidimicrobiaceae bacterium]MBP6486245.1 2-keto-4-pentenoate hydratase [Ilumatobacteraceae bacterium]MBK9971881.1 2-keto-4-pentenoate hydratase [Acidimicrobiaceae bacterium]MBP7887822.1 2-keto-4-pentenoate hydratase [Ilumatobacteraceae bacterium]MBP8210155.1 2-keto-4-pentenoate hydratase [Ilumatobacteraceae bacterium]